MFSKFWTCYNKTQDLFETNTTQTNHVFANRSEEDEIYPLIVKKIVEAQIAVITLKHSFNCNAVLDKGLELQLVENESCKCNKGKLIIPKPLQQRETIWYHHNLQHPGHTRLKETIKSGTYRKEMRNTVRPITKSCKSCQLNKKCTWKYGHHPSKIMISTPWEALCGNLVGPYTLNGKDGSSIDFMALTMINPASSWFEVVELPQSHDWWPGRSTVKRK